MKKDKYYWVNRSSRHHIDRLRAIVPDLPDCDDILRSGNPRFISYIVDEKVSTDGHRVYQFLIEYDIYNPSQGIYFGCKSLTQPGHRHGKECFRALDEWDEMRRELVKRLNNVFVDKDFSYRFRDTDNAADGTFWPFWLSLYEDESVKDFALRALGIMSAVYSDYTGGRIETTDAGEQRDTKVLKVRTAFTDEAFEKLMSRVEESLKILSASKVGRSNGSEGRRLMHAFFSEGERCGLLERCAHYEKAWKMPEGLPDVEFKALMKTLFSYIGERLGVKGMRVPWVYVTRVIMRGNETVYKEQVKTLNVQSDVEEKYAGIIDSLLPQ